MADSSTRHDAAKQLLAVLKAQVEEAQILADQVRDRLAHPFLHPYRQFRTKLEDFDGLSSLVHQRLLEAAASWSDPDPTRSAELMEQSDQLELLMVSLFARATIHFIEALANQRHFPLGSAEQLSQDLAALRANLSRLQSPALKGRADPSLEPGLVAAESMLQDIIHHLPFLPDFSKHWQAAGTRTWSRRRMVMPLR
jgi:hypothetical protein